MERWEGVEGISKNAKISLIKAVDNIRVSLEGNNVNMRLWDRIYKLTSIWYKPTK
jgi:hypothetical protein